MAFFRIDARTIRSGADSTGDAVEEVVGEEGIAAARPEPRRRVPAAGRAADRRRGRDRRRPPARPFLRRGDGCGAPLTPRRASAGAEPDGRRSPASLSSRPWPSAPPWGRPHATAAPPAGAQLAALSAPPTRRAARLAADLLRDDRPLRERRPVERPREAGRAPARRPGSTRRTSAGSTAATSPGSAARAGATRTASRASRRSASRRSGSRRRSARRRCRATAPPTTGTGSPTSPPRTPTSAPPAEFGAMVECAHRLGLKVILDVVVNHTADVISLTGGSAGYVGPEQVPYRDCHGKVFRPVRVPRQAVPVHERQVHAPRPRPARRRPHGEEARVAERPDPLPQTAATSTSRSCNDTCLEQGDFYGLDDLFTERRTSCSGLADVYAGWIERYRIDGIRIDTARHVNAAFFRQWLPRDPRRGRAGGRAGLHRLRRGVRLRHARALPVRPRPRPAERCSTSRCRTSSSATRRVSGDRRGHRLGAGRRRLLPGAANGVAYTPPTFLGNHDMGRVGLLLRQRSGDDATLLRRDLLAHSLLYLLRGAPVVYYGDEVGMMGSGGDKLARQDMFPTGVAEWRTEPRVGSAPDRRRLVARRARPSRRGASRGARPRSGTRTRRSRPARARSARVGPAARRQPLRPHDPARVRRRVQRGHAPRGA